VGDLKAINGILQSLNMTTWLTDVFAPLLNITPDILTLSQQISRELGKISGTKRVDMPSINRFRGQVFLSHLIFPDCSRYIEKVSSNGTEFYPLCDINLVTRPFLKT
jgi:hypothetical protein